MTNEDYTRLDEEAKSAAWKYMQDEIENCLNILKNHTRKITRKYRNRDIRISIYPYLCSCRQNNTPIAIRLKQLVHAYKDYKWCYAIIKTIYQFQKGCDSP